MNNINFKINQKINNKFDIDAYINNELCGTLSFELLNKLDNLFVLPEEIDKFVIVDKYINKNKFIYLSYIVIESKFQGKGISNLLMKRFLKICENNLKIEKILLFACPFIYEKTKVLPLSILSKFYNKFGFNIIYDDNDSYLMYKEIKTI